MKAASIAAHLRASGVAVLRHSEGDYDMDGEVVIDEVLYVQVPVFAGDPLTVNRWVDNGEAVAHYPVTLATLVKTVLQLQGR